MRVVSWFFSDGKPDRHADRRGPLAIRVIMGDESATVKHYHSMYYVDVVTAEFLRAVRIPDGRAGLFVKPSIVVPSFDPDAIDRAVMECAPLIEQCGVRIGY